MGGGSLGRITELFNVIMRTETLDQIPEIPSDRGRGSFFSGLLKSESLPFDEPVPAGLRSPRSSGLFAAEVLPLDAPPAPPEGRTPFIARLFSGEALPVDPAPAPRPGSRGSRG